MPIQFRCSKCSQRLSITSRKAGKNVACPKCGTQLTVPVVKTTVRKAADESILADALERRAATESDADDAQPEFAATGGQIQPPTDFEFAELPSSFTQSTAEQSATASVAADAAAGFVHEATAADLGAEIYAAWTDDGESGEEEDFSLRSADTDFEEMDLTPMVDVTFLLLIFFMITASFSLQKSLQVPPPNPEEKGAQQSEMTLEDFEANSIIVEIDAENGISVDDEKLSDPSELVDTLREKGSSEQKFELVLDADPDAFHETVVTVIDAANEVGMQKIRLATRAESSN